MFKGFPTQSTEIKYGFNGELDDEKFVLRDDLDLYIN